MKLLKLPEPSITAVGTKIIVEQIQSENTTNSGIVITNNNPNPMAKLLSIGEEAATKTPELEVGQMLFVEWRNSLKLEHKGMPFYVLDSSSVYGVAR